MISHQDLAGFSTALLTTMIITLWAGIIIIVLMDEYHKQKGKEE